MVVNAQSFSAQDNITTIDVKIQVEFAVCQSMVFKSFVVATSLYVFCWIAPCTGLPFMLYPSFSVKKE